MRDFWARCVLVLGLNAMICTHVKFLSGIFSTDIKLPHFKRFMKAVPTGMSKASSFKKPNHTHNFLFRFLHAVVRLVKVPTVACSLFLKAEGLNYKSDLVMMAVQFFSVYGLGIWRCQKQTVWNLNPTGDPHCALNFIFIFAKSCDLALSGKGDPLAVGYFNKWKICLGVIWIRSFRQRKTVEIKRSILQTFIGCSVYRPDLLHPFFWLAVCSPLALVESACSARSIVVLKPVAILH